MEDEARVYQGAGTAPSGTPGQDTASRAATVATERVGAMAEDARRWAQDTGRKLEQYTGKSGQAWLDDTSGIIKKHPWKTIALTVAVVYLLGKLRP
jgi:ElaB/YqjD/DUF883 family membrane-anchored ribosome-binding protein